MYMDKKGNLLIRSKNDAWEYTTTRIHSAWEGELIILSEATGIKYWWRMEGAMLFKGAEQISFEELLSTLYRNRKFINDWNRSF